MSKIDPNSLKNWNNGQVMHESEYEQERTIIVTAINANDDQIKAVDAKHVGNAAELDEKIEQKADEIRVYVDQKKVKTSDIEDEAVTTDKVAPGLREDKIELDYPTGQIAQRLAQLEQGDIFAALKGLVVKTYTTTATANQDVFDVSSIGTVAPGNVITFNIDGVPQFGAFEVANATTIEIPDPCVGGEEVIIQWIGSSESGGDGGIETFSSAELITARGGYARLNDRLNAMSPPTFSMPEYKTTATAGQTVFDVSSVGSFAQNQKRILAFNIDGYPQVNYVETSSTKLTIASPCVGGESVFIKFLMGDSIPLVSGHGRAHRKGGIDEINVTELGGYDSLISKIDVQGVSATDARFNAKADGTTDDTSALQSGINFLAAAGGGNLLLGSETYAVNTGGITMKSNVHIVGNGAKIVALSSTTQRTLFVNENGATNIGITGVGFESTNDKTRVNGRLGAGSNINAVRLLNASKVKFSDLSFDGLEFGLKLDNSDILELHNIKSTRTHQPVYTSESRFVRADMLDIECEHALDSQDHNIYLNSGTVDARFNNVTLTGSAGHALVVKTDGFDEDDTSDITFNGLTLVNVFGGVSTFNNVKSCRFTNIAGRSIKTGGSWFRTAYGNDNIVFENFTVEGGCLNVWANQPDATGLTGSVIIRNGELIGRCADHMFVPNNISYLEIDNFKTLEAQPTAAASRVFYASSTSWTNTLVIIKNCVFKYKDFAPTTQPISARSNGRVHVIDNQFINESGTNYSALIYNLTPAKVQFSGNRFQGFTAIIAGSDTASPVCYNNEDVGTGVMRVLGNRKQTFGTSAPTTDTWAVGDVCVNTGSSAGSTEAWVCTVAGTPGTWVPRQDIGLPVRMLQGSYVGNGAAGARTISLPGILPKLIYLTGLGVSTNYVAVIAMPGADTHMGQGANNSSTSAGPYQTSSDSVPKAVTGGFTVAGITNGTDLNVSGRTYHYTVIY